MRAELQGDPRIDHLAALYEAEVAYRERGRRPELDPTRRATAAALFGAASRTRERRLELLRLWKIA
ncbi:MAG: hypothetical protein IT306_29550 [Chloroflexi bacterium]|nr:hypothetical protein [Chloroflexota bacterium]